MLSFLHTHSILFFVVIQLSCILYMLFVYVLLLLSVYVISSAAKMLGQILVTKQTGPQGKIVSKVSF